MEKIKLILIIFIVLLSSFAIKPVTPSISKNSSFKQFSFADYTLIVNDSKFYSRMYINESILVIGNVSVQFNVSFINSSITFYNNPSKNIFSGIFLNVTWVTLNVSSCNIYYVNVNSGISQTRDFFINGNLDTNLIINNSRINVNPNNDNFRFNFFKSHSIDIENTIFNNGNNLFNFTKLFSIYFFNISTLTLNTSFLKADTISIFQFFNSSISLDQTLITNILDLSFITFFILANNQFFSNRSNSSSMDNSNLFNLAHVDKASVINNSFENVGNNFIIQSIGFLNISLNLFINFEKSITLHDVQILYISYNNFNQGNISILFNDLNSFTSYNCYLNNFNNISYVLIISPFTSGQIIMNNNFSYNYYSNFKSIDFNYDGFNDQPYITNYLIDNYSLSQPFENYYIYDNLIILIPSYAYVNTISAKENYVLGFQWQILALFYVFIVFFPIILFLVAKKQGLKKIAKNLDLKNNL